jgi:nifR3 family TIM-barrel protein
MASPGLSIGPHALAVPALLAPMSGVTDHGFRRIAARFGAGAVVSEMVAADQLAAGDEEARLRAEGEGLALHIVQLAGCEAAAMAEGARIAEGAGAHVIDINMGCPAKRVTRGWSGSALMRDLDQAERLIAAVRGAVSVPVTLKMRLGWDEASLNAPDLARRAEANGLALVTVHARTRQQFYKGRADWGAVGAVRAATRLPLVVNGDIGTPAEAAAALAASGADAVMIGRAALGRPWLVGEIGHALAGRAWPRPDADAMAAAALEHYDLLLAGLGREAGIRHARKHVAAYADAARARGVVVASAELAAILQERDERPVRRFLAGLRAPACAEAA